MSSAWGDSWGDTWGDTWGAIAPPLTDGPHEIVRLDSPIVITLSLDSRIET